MKGIRSFALVIIDDFDNVIDRFNLDYVETPSNLGFEMEFTTLESRLTTYFTSARERKVATELTVNFLPPNAYNKLNAFKAFVQKYMNSRMVFEYNDTVEIKNWEGKVQKLGQEELEEWRGIACPISFLPGTPKYIRKDNTISIKYTSEGKAYSLKYPYSYGRTIVQNNEINNTYFDEIPLRVILYGVTSNPTISLIDTASGEVYSAVKFDSLAIGEGEHLIIDAIQSKVLLYRNGAYISAYDYLDKSSEYDTFLWAKENTISKLGTTLSAAESGYLRASYRQYTL